MGKEYQQEHGGMCRRLSLDLRVWHCSRRRNIRFQTIAVLILLSLLHSLFSLTFFSSSHRPEYSDINRDTVQNDSSCLAESFTTTRREAIVDYVMALQAPEGYFHAYLQEPPPFEPDGTEATFSPVLDAYEILKYIDCVDELDWSNTTEFLLSLVDHGLLNLSNSAEPAGYTCRTALTLFPSLGIDAVIDVGANAEFVAGLQGANGGFLTVLWHTIPTLVDTYYALDTLRIAGRLDLIDLTSARSFVLGCYNEDGGFSNTLGGDSDFNYVPAGVPLMEILGLQSELDVDRTTGYLLQFWDNESGCDIQADVLFTQRIAWSLWLLDKEDSIDTAKLLQWVLGLQKHAHGEFVGYPEASLDNERLFFANLATHILAMYNGSHLLDSEFLVDERPVWTIPQWWIDYINSEWGTISNQDGSFHYWFVTPLFVVTVLIPLCIVISMMYLAQRYGERG